MYLRVPRHPNLTKAEKVAATKVSMMDKERKTDPDIQEVERRIIRSLLMCFLWRNYYRVNPDLPPDLLLRAWFAVLKIPSYLYMQIRIMSKIWISILIKIICHCFMVSHLFCLVFYLSF